MSNDTPQDAVSAMASEPMDELDSSTLRAMREVYARLDPPPSSLVDRITFALTLAGLQAEIAELERMPVAGVRAEEEFTAATTLTFTSSTLSLMVTISPEGGLGGSPTVRIDGWATEPGVTVELHIDRKTMTAIADSTGRVEWDGVPRGSAQFVIRPVDEHERPVVTPRVEL
jgi:hypothetical protein